MYNVLICDDQPAIVKAVFIFSRSKYQNYIVLFNGRGETTPMQATSSPHHTICQ